MNHKKGKHLIIGSENSRRVKYWQEALQHKGYEYRLLTYQQVMTKDFPVISEPMTLRITSPGEDFDLNKKLLKLGGFPNTSKLTFEKGLLIPNQNWYQGWSLVLQKIAAFVQRNPLLKTMNSPAAIQLAFHKLKCQQLLHSKDIKTPKIIINRLQNHEQLIEKLQAENIPQVFIKPYHGSSASGVMAFRQSKGKQVLYTTIDLRSSKLYNNLRLQKYTSPSEIKTIIDAMVPAGLLVEKWVRKKSFDQKSVDFRVLVVNGKAAFVVPRISKHFITNLHLGNLKGDIDEVKKAWGDKLIEDAKELAVNAVRQIDGLFYAGVDVAISTSGVAYVLEVNAFGDLLLGVYKGGLDCYGVELEEWDETGRGVFNLGVSRRDVESAEERGI